MNDSVEITRTGMLATGQRFELLPERPVPYASIGGSSTVFYLAALNVRPGDSGAPVYSLQSGKVIGICLGYLPEPAVRIVPGGHENAQIDGSIVYSNAGIAVVAPIKYVVSILPNVR